MIRKIREAMTAVQIESYYSKNEILELYLNQVYLGAGVYGVDAAAHYYFSKPASKLNLNECSVIAGIIQLPERYRPDKKNNMTRIINRRGKVLQAMQKMRFIDDQAVQTVSQMSVPYNPQLDVSQRAPYFVEHIRKYCEQKYGDDLLYNGGLTIYTTLDLDAQDAIEKDLKGQLKDLQNKMNSYFLDRTNFWRRKKIPQDFFLAHFDSLYNIYKSECEKFPDSLRLRIVQTAITAMDVKTGAVLAMVGGRDFMESKFNRAMQAVRQPGSAFKPFVYTAAIDHGMTPATMLLDQPITLMTPQGEWHPENFDKTFRGPVTLRFALNHSLNMVAIQTLMQVGGDTVVSYARRMGLRQHLEPVPSLAIGSCEVIPFELLTAYAIFPNKGAKTTPYFVRRIVDRDGKILEEHEPSPQVQVLTPQTAYMMCDLLQGVVRNGTAAAIPGLGFPRPSAGKTGTSNDYSDAWFVGFTPQVVCCVWIGIDERHSLGWGLTGSLAAVPIYTKAMIALHKKIPVADFEKPDGVVSMKVCLASHKLACNACPQTYSEVFIADKLPEPCDLHGAGRAKKADMMQYFGPQEQQDKSVPVKKRLSF
jgi:penicillin-binding protein 1A